MTETPIPRPEARYGRPRLSRMSRRRAVIALAVLAVAAGLLVYPQVAHLEFFEARRKRQLMTGTGYIARVGQWLRESF